MDNQAAISQTVGITPSETQQRRTSSSMQPQLPIQTQVTLAQPQVLSQPVGQQVFKRFEKKYVLNGVAYRKMRVALADRMTVDSYGKVCVSSLYLDTPDSLLIRRSLEKPLYKEKMRLRSYGLVTNGRHPVFLELKKKFEGVVYKRRIPMALDEGMDYLTHGVYPASLLSADGLPGVRTYQVETVGRVTDREGEVSRAEVNLQMLKELDWALAFYKDLQPSMLISCNRVGLFGDDDPNLRVTFDSDLLWRIDDLRLDGPVRGTAFFDDEVHLMEIKFLRAFPLWLVHILDRFEIRSSSFSKYGSAYKASQTQLLRSHTTMKGER